MGLRMITKVYLDMDGVLVNFEKRYEELFGQKPSQVKNLTGRESYFWKNWKAFVEGCNFETLEMLPDAQELLGFAKEMQKQGIDIEILSSSGGDKYHETVTLQKKEWLRKHNIDFYPNIVNGGSRKALFALPGSILIDDTERIIKYFTDAGGIGILHTSAYDTINKVKPLLGRQLKYELHYL